MSELIYAGKTLPEIAGYDTVQINYVLGRKRDKYGRLVRHGDLPKWVEVDERGNRIITRPVPFEVAFKKAKLKAGVERKRVDAIWKYFEEQNPKMGKGG